MPDDARTRAVKWALSSESAARIHAALDLARHLPPIADDGGGWNHVYHKLAVANGVLDLRNGVLEDGMPEDRISLGTNIAYDADAAAPRWAQFLDEVFVVPELIDYIQLAAGYSFTGEISEHCFFFCHGGGANGKSTFLGILKYVAGELGYTLPFAVLEPSRNAGEGASPYMADLDGPRFVVASEVRENTKLDESRIKALSGGDEITARRLHAAPFTYRPQLKLWLGVNHKPAVADESDGFWRRPRFIPFMQQFKGAAQDTLLFDRLKEEAPGILRWAVEGAVKWYAAIAASGGRPVLGDVPGAGEMLKEWRAESDPLEEWLLERCIQRADLKAEVGSVHRDYCEWCDDNRISQRNRLTRKSLSRRLSDRFGKTKIMGKRYISGIGLLAESQEAAF